MLKRFERLMKQKLIFEMCDDYFLLTAQEKEIVAIAQIFKKSSFFKTNQLLDVFAIDYPEQSKRFVLNYNLISLTFKQRIILRTIVAEDTTPYSIKNIYESADWPEREIWDMFGVFFVYSSSLRRILTDYGFTGHPLRRDFPLSGYLAVRWSREKSKVISEPLAASQEFRYFEFENPWKDR